MAKKTDMGKQVGFGFSKLGAQLLSSMDQPARNPDTRAARYEEMLDDETIGTGLEFLCYSVVSKIGEFTHPDEKIKELVSQSVENLKGTLETYRKSLLESTLAYGFGVMEFSLVSEDGSWKLSGLQNYDPGTLEFKFAREKDNSVQIAEIIQKVVGQEFKIPVGKSVVHTHGGGASPYGKSRLKRCWRWYAFKRAIPKFWAIALEKFGMPTLIGRSQDVEQMSDVLENSYAKAHFAIGQDDSIEALASGMGSMGGQYGQAIEFCNKMLYRSMFLPSLLEGGEGGGSFALGSIHWRMFNDACLWLARELAEVEIEQLWRPIIEWNYGPQENYGQLDVSDSGTPEEHKIISEVFMNGVNAGYLYPDEGDAEWMRERLGFPEEPEGGEAVPWRSRLSQNSSPAGSEENETTP